MNRRSPYGFMSKALGWPEVRGQLEPPVKDPAVQVLLFVRSGVPVHSAYQMLFLC